jgi:hypothetical protein
MQMQRGCNGADVAFYFHLTVAPVDRGLQQCATTLSEGTGHMIVVVGIALIALTVAMVVVARPKDGKSAPFLKNWVIGQGYVLAAMASSVIGITIAISNW